MSDKRKSNGEKGRKGEHLGPGVAGSNRKKCILSDDTGGPYRGKNIERGAEWKKGVGMA